MQQQMNQDARRPEPSVYPLTGICYFLAHPGLWPYALCPLVGGVVVLIFTMIFIFSTLLEPQERLIDSWLGYNAFLCYLIAVLLCLAEIVIATFALLQLVVAVTMEKVPPPAAQTVVQVARQARQLMVLSAQVFIQTMKNEGQWLGDDNAVCRCGDLVWFTCWSTCVAIVTLPLHLVPFVGTLLFSAINGAMLAWEYHELLFDMSGLSKKEQKQLVWTNVGDYMRFGMVAYSLQMIPVFGLVAFFTKAVGDALWATELCKRGLVPQGAALSGQGAAMLAPMRSDQGGLQLNQLLVPSNSQAPQFAQPQQTMVQATVPPGLHEGMMMQVTGPTGEAMQVAVPPGAGPGAVVNVPVTVHHVERQPVASAPPMVHAQEVQLVP